MTGWQRVCCQSIADRVDTQGADTIPARKHCELIFKDVEDAGITGSVKAIPAAGMHLRLLTLYVHVLGLHNWVNRLIGCCCVLSCLGISTRVMLVSISKQAIVDLLQAEERPSEQ